jgi:putative ABC transport system permease protein
MDDGAGRALLERFSRRLAVRLEFSLGLRYLNGRKLRTVLTTLAIMFGVLVFFGLNTIVPAFVAAFQANALAMAGQVDATITSKTGEGFPSSVADRVAAVDGVRALSPSLERTVNLPADYFDHDPSSPDAVSAVGLVGIDPGMAQTVASYPVKEGRFLEAGDQAAAVISESLAEAAGVQLGGTLTIPSTGGLIQLKVVGLLPQRLLPGNEEILVTSTEAQTLLDAPGKINTIEVIFDSENVARRAQIEAALEAALGGNYQIGGLSPGAELLSNVRLGGVLINVLAILGLLMGGFIIFNTFRTVVAERRRDIGMLRAVGGSRRMISGIVLAEGVIQGTIGTGLGLLLGYLFAIVVLRAVAPLLKTFVNLRLMGPQITPGLMGSAILLGVGITLLAGWLPARAAARVTPLEALRPRIAEVSLGRAVGVGFWGGAVMIALAIVALVSGQSGLITLGGVLFLVGLILVAPALVEPVAALFGRLLAIIFARNGTAELAEGNLSRQPARAAVTASTTMIALAVLVMAASLITSVSIGFLSVLRKSLGSDFLLIPPSIGVWGSDVGASPQLAEQLRAIDGVQVVSTLRYAATQIRGKPVALLGIDPQAYTEVSGLTFSQGDPHAAYEAVNSGHGLIMNGVGSRAAGVKLGDQVTLLTPTGEETYKVVGIANDYLNAKVLTAYMSQANIASDFGKTEDVFIQLNLKPGANAAAVEAHLKQAVRQYPQFKLVAGQAYYEQNKGLFSSLFAGFYAMMFFLAIPSLIAMVNTLAIGVIERTREVGMLRAVGATRRQIRSMIVAEALILAAIGTALGLLAGSYLGYMTAQALGALGFPIQYAFPAGGWLVAIAIGLLFGALAAIIPARQAARMDVVAALRYE